MGRLLTSKYVITGKLIAQSPIHVGAAFGDLVADQPLARDGAGRHYLPGTSLAGPMRSWWIRRGYDAENHFGRTPKRDDPANEGHASYITVDDAPVAEAGPIEIRDGVGIDRRTGAAAEGIKYDREVLPRGTHFEFCAEIEVWSGEASVSPSVDQEKPVPPEPATTRRQVGELIGALERGDIRFGAAKTRGLGRLRLTETHVTAQVLGERAGLIARLRQAGELPENLRNEFVEAGIAASSDEIAIRITWHPDLPVMNKSEAEGVSIDAVPLVTADGDRLKPVITGASIKGVLRAHGERICRTLAAAQPDDPASRTPGTSPKGPKQDFLDDLAECELIEALYGAAGKGPKEDAQYEDDQRVRMPGLGALSVHDCLLDKPITRAEWRQLLSVNPGQDQQKPTALRQIIDKPDSTWKDFRVATHVAIDRWTGGAAESLLFSRLEPAADGTHEFELSLDVDRIAPSLPAGAATAGFKTNTLDEHELTKIRQAAFGLLIATVRDLARGRVPIGFGTTRGLGSITVERIELRMSEPIATKLGIEVKGNADEVIVIDPHGFEEEQKMQAFAAVQEGWLAYWEEVKLGIRHA
jgi:CRISPR/Cas system CSM-associated protein Csm3 (group 7 of RAMP superfamily)